jgi:hypothetical protein
MTGQVSNGFRGCGERAVCHQGAVLLEEAVAGAGHRRAVRILVDQGDFLDGCCFLTLDLRVFLNYIPNS